MRINGDTYEIVDKEPEVGDQVLITRFDKEECFELRKVLEIVEDDDIYVDPPIQVSPSDEPDHFVGQDDGFDEYSVVRKVGEQQTRFTFDGVEYGVVDRESVVGDSVVVTRIDEGDVTAFISEIVSFRSLGEVDDGLITLNSGDDLCVNNPDCDVYHLVEPIEPAPKKPLTLTELLEDIADEVDVYSPSIGVAASQSDRITATCAEVRDLLIRKNHDYGDSFSVQFRKYGLLSALIRMDDKMARLDTLYNCEVDSQVDESIEDTLADLAGYALLSLVELRKGRG